jgi:hypothetical protein
LPQEQLHITDSFMRRSEFDIMVRQKKKKNIHSPTKQSIFMACLFEKPLLRGYQAFKISALRLYLFGNWSFYRKDQKGPPACDITDDTVNPTSRILWFGNT